MNALVRAIALGVIRNAATAAGAWLVAHGYMAASQSDGWLGSILFLAGLGFTIYDNFAVKSKIETAHATPAAQPLPEGM
jgi:hypothetical protein